MTAPLAGWLGPWANTIAEHHERFDGLGYPFGLAGQEISTGGRIVAVADCYDTMTSLRSYKKPMPTEAARAELAACSGAQFDPIIVRAFLAVSVSRLHALAPLTWIASLPFGNLGPQLARLAAVGGRVGATGVVATVGVVGLTAGQQAMGSAALTPLSATHRAGAGAPAPGGTTTGATVGPGRGGTGVGPARSGSSTHVGTGTRTTVSDGGGPQPTGSGKVGDDAGGADQAPAGPGGGGSDDGTTTTVASGTVSSTPTSTVGGSSPTTTTTTTSTTVPPPLPPGAVSAKSSCQLVILVPEVTLTWTASPTGAVTGYTILRSTSKTGPYSSVATVAGRTTVTYADTTASGLSTTYWYELESVAGSSSSSPTSAVSATTGALCL